MKPQIIQELGAELAGKSRSEARRLIEKYFSKITWSLEKAEWDGMSESEKIAFVDKARRNVRQAGGSPQNGW
jgi:hypothetical protein